ncbi:hypothetical protein F4805DRAFT_422343 [Annulohypoxylon moriforme]|nr:hypothetical protein F4805DRAFT_422343 [Annulohypoxylon moriforme]
MEVPTYRRAPNFSIPSNGPLRLGTVVEDLKELQPLNESDRVEVPTENTYRTRDKGFSTTLEKVREHDLGVVARIFGIEGLGGEVGTSFQKNRETAIYVRELETEFFYPSTKYIAETLASEGIKTYMEITRKKFPVYMITGLKIAHGASWSSGRSGGFGVNVEVAVPEPMSGIVDVGPKVEANYTTKKATAVEDADSFVLAYRATKIWYRWNNKDEFKTQAYQTGATMADDRSFPVVREDGEYQVTRDIGAEDGAGEDVVLVEEPTGGIEPSRWIIPA